LVGGAAGVERGRFWGAEVGIDEERVRERRDGVGIFAGRAMEMKPLLDLTRMGDPSPDIPQGRFWLYFKDAALL
jgi:hypothetical protein